MKNSTNSLSTISAAFGVTKCVLGDKIVRFILRPTASGRPHPLSSGQELITAMGSDFHSHCGFARGFHVLMRPMRTRLLRGSMSGKQSSASTIMEESALIIGYVLNAWLL